MCIFGRQILVAKVCEYIKSGHTFGHCTVNVLTGYEQEMNVLLVIKIKVFYSWENMANNI
jgi:hypothetical protein